MSFTELGTDEPHNIQGDLYQVVMSGRLSSIQRELDTLRRELDAFRQTVEVQAHTIQLQQCVIDCLNEQVESLSGY